jgi:hypothetical protein
MEVWIDYQSMMIQPMGCCPELVFACVSIGMADACFGADPTFFAP